MDFDRDVHGFLHGVGFVDGYGDLDGYFDGYCHLLLDGVGLWHVHRDRIGYFFLHGNWYFFHDGVGLRHVFHHSDGLDVVFVSVSFVSAAAAAAAATVSQMETALILLPGLDGFAFAVAFSACQDQKRAKR